MKKIFALLLAAVMCFSLVACGGGEINTNESTGANSNQSADSTDYANEFAELLCGGKWVTEEGDANLTFDKDGTFVFSSDSENVNCTWSFERYFGSFSEFPLAIGSQPEFSNDYCVFWGYGRGYKSFDIIVGYNNDGMLIMHYNDQYWTKTE